MDGMTLIMLAMIGVLIIFMVRNGKKRREQMAQMQSGIQPGAEVMTQSGIFGTVESIDDEDENKVTLLSGTTLLVVHRNAIGNILTRVETEDTTTELAPDDDPAFGEQLADSDGVETFGEETDNTDSETGEQK